MLFSSFFDLSPKKFHSDDINFYLEHFDRFAVPEQYSRKESGSFTLDRLGIAGAGLMGCSIAAAFIQSGTSVLLYDPLPAACQSAPDRIRTELSFQLPEKSEQEIRELVECRLKTTSALNDLTGLPFLLETIPEKLKLKQKFYTQIDAVCNRETVLFSNTSTIKITDLSSVFSARCKNLSAERCCGFHFFHPVRRRSLTEIIRGEESGSETIARAVQIARLINKTPVVVNDGPAFLVNRLLNPYLNESMTLLEQGAPMQMIESACSRFGMEMSPFRIMDEIGLDVALHSGWTIRKASPELITSEEIMIRLIDRKRLGRKSGQGFFRYSNYKTCWESPAEHDPEFDILLAEIQSKQRRIDPFFKAEGWTEEEIGARIFSAVLLEAGRIIDSGIVASFELTDMALVLGLGFPRSRGGIYYWANHFGLARLLKMIEYFRPLGPRYEIPNILKQAGSENSDQ